MNNKIKQIVVDGVLYDITDPNLPDYIRTISKEQIAEWNSKDYNLLNNKPSINENPLEGNKTSEALGLQDKMEAMSNLDIEKLLG